MSSLFVGMWYNRINSIFVSVAGLVTNEKDTVTCFGFRREPFKVVDEQEFKIGK